MFASEVDATHSTYPIGRVTVYLLLHTLPNSKKL